MKTLKFLLLMAGLFLLAPPLFAQDPGGGTIPDYNVYFLTIGGFVLLLNLVAEGIKNLFNLSGLTMQIVSWCLGVGLAILAWVFHLGMFVDIPIWLAACYGFGATLIANGVFSTGLIEWLLTIIRVYQKPPPPRIKQ